MLVSHVGFFVRLMDQPFLLYQFERLLSSGLFMLGFINLLAFGWFLLIAFEYFRLVVIFDYRFHFSTTFGSGLQRCSSCFQFQQFQLESAYFTTAFARPFHLSYKNNTLYEDIDD